jgi:outer membrane receptor for ferrienterochelin and colicin
MLGFSQVKIQDYKTFLLWMLMVAAFLTPHLLFGAGSLATDMQDSQIEEPNQLLDLSIEELINMEIDQVYTASKFKQKISEAPSSVTIITAEDIKLYGYRTLADILQSVRGFYATYDRYYHYLGVRGFGRPGDYNSRILILMNGHRINENVGDSTYIGTEFVVDVDLIERVEIIRGPGSSLYGSNAFFAVINVITKTGKNLNATELSGEIASHDTLKGRTTFGRFFETPQVDVLLSATIYDSEGDTLYFKEFDNPATRNGYVDHDGDENYSFFGKVSWKDFTFQAASVSRLKDIPTAPWDTVFADPRTKSWDDTTTLGLTYRHEFSEKFSVLGKVSYNHYNYDGRWVYDYAEETDPEPYIVVNKDYWKGRGWNGEWQFIMQPWENHKIIAGVEYQYNSRQEQACWDEEVYLFDTRHSKNWGVFFQDEFKILDNLILNAGVRHDDYDFCGNTTNPRLALIHQPWKDTTLKLLYGEAFRAPSTYELYYHDGYWSAKPGDDLEPETITSYEVVLEQKLGQHFRATVNGFYNDIEDLIEQELDPADDLLVFRNLDGVVAKGMELELEGKLDCGIRGKVSYAFVDTETDDTQSSLSNSPQHMAKLNLIVPVVKDKLFAGIETQFFSERKTLTGHHADDYFLTNLTLFSMNILEGLEFSASVYNLFDQDYAYPGFGEHLQDILYQNGRILRFKLTYRF